jgi:hypothetical protein
MMVQTFQTPHALDQVAFFASKETAYFHKKYTIFSFCLDFNFVLTTPSARHRLVFLVLTTLYSGFLLLNQNAECRAILPFIAK